MDCSVTMKQTTVVKAFNVGEFIEMYEVKGGIADELMRIVTCWYLSRFPGARKVALTKKFTDGLSEKSSGPSRE
jgi:hypothetical protein